MSDIIIIVYYDLLYDRWLAVYAPVLATYYCIRLVLVQPTRTQENGVHGVYTHTRTYTRIYFKLHAQQAGRQDIILVYTTVIANKLVYGVVVMITMIDDSVIVVIVCDHR